MILAIPDVLSADDIATCRAVLASADWEDGRATAGHLAASVKSNRQLPLESPAARQLGESVMARLGQSPLFIAGTLPMRILPPRFSCYESGETYGNHIDNALFRMPGSDDYLRTDISCTLFISAPDAYDGGELVIEDSYGDHRVKLPAGHMVIYPSSSHHRVEPVTRGTRLVSFFWVQSLVAAEMNRRTLFELDSTIQTLTVDHPGHGSIAALTGIYHNLLRSWSQT